VFNLSNGKGKKMRTFLKILLFVTSVFIVKAFVDAVPPNSAAAQSNNLPYPPPATNPYPGPGVLIPIATQPPITPKEVIFDVSINLQVRIEGLT
jgi:hypothetical protein